MTQLARSLAALSLLASLAGAQLTADFTATPTSGTNPLTVDFTDTSSGGTIIAWSWDFGDGSLSSSQHPQHTYTTPGSYGVKLTVLGPGFTSDTLVQPDLVQVAPGDLVAGFTATPTSGTQPLDVQFVDASTGLVDSWLWDFGDGTSSTAQHPQHTYEVVATTAFDVGLTVGSGGQFASVLVEDAVLVEPAVITPSFGVSRPALLSGQFVALTNTSVAPPGTQFAWDLDPFLYVPDGDPPLRPYVEQPTWFDVDLGATLGPQHELASQERAFGVLPSRFSPPGPELELFGRNALLGADVDQDGDTDVLLKLTTQLLWLANDGSGSFGDATLVTGGLQSDAEVAVADWTGDGAPDVIYFDDDSNELFSGWVVNDGSGGFSAPVPVAVLDNRRTHDVVALDIDLDGDLDLAATQSQFQGAWQSRVVLAENVDTVGSFPLVAQNTTILTSTLHVFDGDQDGDDDLFGDSGWLRNQHPGWIHHDGGWDAPGGGVGDLDLDGDVDGLGGLGSNVRWIENLGGQPAMLAHDLSISQPNVGDMRLAHLADADLDGDLDALNVDGGGWGWLQHPGDPDATWTYHAVADGLTPSAVVADVDSDGDVDWVHNQGEILAGENPLQVRPNRTLDPLWPTTTVGLAGTSGRPGLVGHAGLVGGQAFGLAVDQARPGAAALLVVGVVALDAPFKGGVLGPDPLLVLPVGSVADDGTLAIIADWPTGLPAGVPLWLQAWVPDAQAPAGFAASRTLRGETQ